jgi:hypothetical protein
MRQKDAALLEKEKATLEVELARTRDTLEAERAKMAASFDQERLMMQRMREQLESQLEEQRQELELARAAAKGPRRISVGFPGVSSLESCYGRCWSVGGIGGSAVCGVARASG